MKIIPHLCALIAWCGIFFDPARGSAATFVGSHISPPPVAREFRGVWVASIGNIDWPSKAGLTTAEQQTELRALLDHAVGLKLNAIILQVRPGCDALYASRLEPWSEYLTGTMGRAPEPFYDPLALAIEEAHRRGLELHAWFNPYRARHTSAKSPIAATHLSKTHPELIRKYGPLLWLDPAERGVQDHCANVILDVVRRYDVDGVHLDDYFYPYPEKNAAGKLVEFPDHKTWQAYVKRGGKLSREDWRRDNVNRFMHRLHDSIHAEKSWVKFGVSPFGIWRPDNPPTVKGLDAYDRLFADARLWLTNGWLDYCAPQLYWNIDAPQQRFPVLLKWWTEQNTTHRHLWPGLSIKPVGSPVRAPQEIINQIKLTRDQTGVTGSLLWDMKPLQQNRDGITDALRTNVFTQFALVPASPWLGQATLGNPQLSQGKDTASGQFVVHWEPAVAVEKIRWWLVQSRVGGRWAAQVFAANQRTVSVGGSAPEVLAVTAIDRTGNASAPTVIEQAK